MYMWSQETLEANLLHLVDEGLVSLDDDNVNLTEVGFHVIEGRMRSYCPHL